MPDRDPTLDDALARAGLAERLVASRGQERTDLAARLELVTLERDQLRLALAAAERDRDTFLELWSQSKAECGRLVDVLEAVEAANPPRPVRAEVADYADERDRAIAANRDDEDGPWVPVLTGRIPTAGGMGAVAVHDPDDPVARAFFTDDPDAHRAAAAEMVADARRRAGLAEVDRLSTSLEPDPAAAAAQSDAAERAWEHEMVDPPEDPAG